MATHRMASKKNWAFVRRLVGCDRLELTALAALGRIHDPARDYVNFLHPVHRLTEKIAIAARVTPRYDTAQTPHRRLPGSGTLTKKAERQLAVKSKALDPLSLKLELESAQRTLTERAVWPAVAHPLRSETHEATVSLWSDPQLRQD